MESLDLHEVRDFVGRNIINFHETRLERIKGIKLKEIIERKNPYLFKAKYVNKASELIEAILEAYLSSSEEKIFGDFLEKLAIFISGKTCGGKKSSATGIDFEFSKDGTVYLVSVKSGPNWGNNSQHKKQEADFQKAIKTLKQSKHVANVEAVLGICYGKARSSYLNGYWKHVGQSFWYFISGNENLYTDIIEPLGHKAKEYNEDFKRNRDALSNRLTLEFMREFCDENGFINWIKVVRFNSSNLNLKTPEDLF